VEVRVPLGLSVCETVGACQWDSVPLTVADGVCESVGICELESDVNTLGPGVWLELCVPLIFQRRGGSLRL
jgi:hypothetical protein